MRNTIIVLWIILFSSINLGHCYASNIHQEYQRIDTLKVVKSIKANYALINAKTAQFRTVKKTVEGESTEGGEAVGYFQGKKLKKVVTTLYGETGKCIIEDYYDDNSLCFEYRKDYYYDKPISEKECCIVKLTESRFNYFNNTLIRWIDQDKVIPPNSKQFKEFSRETKWDARNVFGMQ